LNTALSNVPLFGLLDCFYTTH